MESKQIILDHINNQDEELSYIAKEIWDHPQVGWQGKYVSCEERQPANLTFVIDVSGSMTGDNRLGLLVDSLRDDDRVSIVT